MSSRVWTLAAFACVVAGVAALLWIARTELDEDPPTDAPSVPPRVVVRETAVPESERKPGGPFRVHAIECVRGPVSTVVVCDEVYAREVDADIRASGDKEFELFDSLLSPRRGVVLYQQRLSVCAGIFDPQDGRRARVCKLTWCGATNAIKSARLVDDAHGLRAEIVRGSDGRTDVWELAMGRDDLGRDKLECRKKPQSD